MSQRVLCILLTGTAMAGASACEMLLGFEDHRLGSLDGGAGEKPSAGGQAGGSSGGGGGGGTGGSSAASGSGGTPNTGGSAGSGGAGASGVGGSSGGAGQAGAAGQSGSGGGCALCEIGALLAHRYRYDGAGTEATDTIGGRHGEVIGTELSDTGELTLSGADQYVELPNGLLSLLTDATLEAWVTWNGTTNWQRIFDFGDNTSDVEGMRGTGRSYLFLTPRAGNGVLRAAYSVNGAAGEVVVNGAGPLEAGTLTQVVVVVEGTTLRLFRNGAVEGFAGPIGPLPGINDINVWVGRSQYTSDPDFAGVLHDFRIYAAALSDAQIATLFAAGPDTTLAAE